MIFHNGFVLVFQISSWLPYQSVVFLLYQIVIFIFVTRV
jgi:hypothetical protein